VVDNSTVHGTGCAALCWWISKLAALKCLFCIQVIIAFSCGSYGVKLGTNLESLGHVMDPCFVGYQQSFCCAIKRMFGFMAWQIPFRVIMYSAVSQIETLKPGLHENLGHLCHEFFHLHGKCGGCQASNFRHWGQIQTGTMPKKLSWKPGLSYALCCGSCCGSQ